MKFDKLYPVAKRTIIGPYPPFRPDPARCPDLEHNTACWECRKCKALTGWQVLIKNDYYLCVCSTECYKALTKTNPWENTDGKAAVGDGSLGVSEGSLQVPPAQPAKD